MENATLTCATEWNESNLACIFSGASILVKISHVTSVVVHFNEMHKNLKNRQLSVKFWPGFAPESVSTSVIVPFFLLFVFRLHHHHHLCPGPPLQEILALWHFHLNSDKKISPILQKNWEQRMHKCCLWWRLPHLQLICWRQRFLHSSGKTSRNLNQSHRAKEFSANGSHQPKNIYVSVCTHLATSHSVTALGGTSPLGGLFELRNRASGKLCWYNPPHLLWISDVFWNKDTVW